MSEVFRLVAELRRNIRDIHSIRGDERRRATGQLGPEIASVCRNIRFI
jgi:hypothetical protein